MSLWYCKVHGYHGPKNGTNASCLICGKQSERVLEIGGTTDMDGLQARIKTIEDQVNSLQTPVHEDLPKYLHAFTTKMQEQEDRINQLAEGLTVVVDTLQQIQEALKVQTQGGVFIP